MKKVLIATFSIFAFALIMSCNKKTGTAVFWTTNTNVWPCTVTVNGVSEVIGNDWPSAPNCGDAFTATFTDLEEGNYSWSAVNWDNQTWSGTVSITEGVCTKMKLQGGSGSAMFWTDNWFVWPCTVTVNSVVKVINDDWSTSPNCGDLATATFTDLEAGVHSWSAVNYSSATWGGTITVTDGGCSKMKLTF